MHEMNLMQSPNKIYYPGTFSSQSNTQTIKHAKKIAASGILKVSEIKTPKSLEDAARNDDESIDNSTSNGKFTAALSEKNLKEFNNMKFPNDKKIVKSPVQKEKIKNKSAFCVKNLGASLGSSLPSNYELNEEKKVLFVPHSPTKVQKLENELAIIERALHLMIHDNKQTKVLIEEAEQWSLLKDEELLSEKRLMLSSIRETAQKIEEEQKKLLEHVSVTGPRRHRSPAASAKASSKWSESSKTSGKSFHPFSSS